MRVVIPHVGSRHPLTEAGAPTGTQWRDVSGDTHAYWRLMCELWEPSDDLLIIEHDVCVWPDIVERFDACPEPFCVFPYDNMCHWACMEAWANMLGCTRFRKELIAACPDAVSSIPADQRDWHNLCDSIAGDKVGGMPAPQRPEGVRARFGHHWHLPAVYHHRGVQRPEPDPPVDLDAWRWATG